MDLRGRWLVTCVLACVVGCAGTEVPEAPLSMAAESPALKGEAAKSVTATPPASDADFVAEPEPEAQERAVTPSPSERREIEGLLAGRPSAAAAKKPARRARSRKARGRPSRYAIEGPPEPQAQYGALGSAGSGALADELGHGLRARSGGGVGSGGMGLGNVRSAPLQRLPVQPEASREGYAHVAEHDFMSVHDQALSTFSVDVDTASYSNVRRILREGRLPPTDAVRIEELINYFDYAYPKPDGSRPFSVHAEVGDCPWNEAHRLVHIGVKGRELARKNVPARNLVFLVDVSGSMQSQDKLPLLTSGLSMLAKDLRAKDRISIVVYAGASGVVLPPTSGRNRSAVLAALQNLRAGGSTNGAAGIELAYRMAQQQFIKGGINRVILATDGDFNVGPSSNGELVRLIEKKRQGGVFLTVLGFGRGNLQDSRMEQLADKGNGNYAYIDNREEAHKVLVREAGATLVTIAKDVKLQVEFNPTHVASYRLIGYENRALKARDFNDDKKDAGEIGAGHTVTALYEVVPAGSDESAAAPQVDALRYQKGRHDSAAARSGELLTVKIRYKAPDGERSRLITSPLQDHHRALSATSPAFRFSAAVAGFGMLLRGSRQAGAANVHQLHELAASAMQNDPHGDRSEFLDMMRAAKRLGLGG